MTAINRKLLPHIWLPFLNPATAQITLKATCTPVALTPDHQFALLSYMLFAYLLTPCKIPPFQGTHWQRLSELILLYDIEYHIHCRANVWRSLRLWNRKPNKQTKIRKGKWGKEIQRIKNFKTLKLPLTSPNIPTSHEHAPSSNRLPLSYSTNPTPPIFPTADDHTPAHHETCPNPYDPDTSNSAMQNYLPALTMI